MRTETVKQGNGGTIIRARGISKVYQEGANEFRALSDLDLDIHGGQLTLLMGPSGSGKTTLLSILGCILRASGGRLELLGEDVSTLPEKELPRIRRDAIGPQRAGGHKNPRNPGGAGSRAETP